MKKLLCVFLTAVFAIGLSVFSFAQQAERIKISVNDPEQWALIDSARYSKKKFEETASLSVSAESEIHSLYLVFDAPAPVSITISDKNGEQIFSHGFIHDYIKLEKSVKDFALTLPKGAILCDIYAFSEGEPPSWVQQWQPNDAPCDVLLLPTHADDDMLYFGAAIAHSVNKEGCEVQLAYMVNHNEQYYRPHELLNGLWEMKVTRYPIVSPFADVYSPSLEHAKTVFSENEVINYKTNLIKKLKPQIIIAHDLNGEYGHGAQVLNARATVAAIEKAALGENGWNTPKVYVHLYDENRIIFDCDSPLATYDGANAYEMAVRGFSHNKSQNPHFKVDKDGPHNIKEFGLYHTTVGTDKSNNIFENITLYRDMPKPEIVPEAAVSQDEVKEIEAVAEFTPEVEAVEAMAQIPTDPITQNEKNLFMPKAENDFVFTFVGSPYVLIPLICIPPVIFFLVIAKSKSEDDFET